MKSRGDADLNEPQPIDWRIMALAAAIYSALSVWMAWASVGFLEADGMTHYLSRRFALDRPIHLVGIWNRPFCVALYCIPAKLGGLLGTRLMSLALVLAMTLVTLAVAKRLPIHRPTLAGLLLLTQPLLFAHSFSELTEVPFALLLIVMFWTYQRRWFWLLAALTAISPLARPEGFGLLMLVTATLLLHRKWYWLSILPMGLLGWSAVGWHLYGQPSEYPWWRWLPNNWPYSADSTYGSGSVFRFAGILPAVVGPIAFGFLVFGIARVAQLLCAKVDGDGAQASAESGTVAAQFGVVGRFFTNHSARCVALVAFVPLGVLCAHSVLWALGKMASNGEPRYMLIVAPFWALLAAFGLDALVERIKPLRPGLVIAAAALIPIVVNVTYPAFPLKEHDDDRIAVKIKAWLDEHAELRKDYPLLAASLPHLFLLMDMDRMDTERIVDSSRTIASNPRPGILLVWSTDYSTHNSDREYCVPESMLIESGWKQIARLSENEGPYKREAVIYLSPEPMR